MVLRPFLQPLWAATYSTSAGAPPNTVGTKQLLPTLRWIHASLEGSPGSIPRRFDLMAYKRLGSRMEIGIDVRHSVSAVGLPRTFGFPCAFRVPPEDRRISNISTAGSRGQQLGVFGRSCGTWFVDAHAV